MYNTFINHLRTLINSLNEPLLVACSGGSDSMALAGLCWEAKLNFSVAHINYGLRSTESDGDEELVLNWCRLNIIPCYIKKANTVEYIIENNIGVQEGARKLRYEWMQLLCKEKKINYILTAHHADDLAETFFINVIRGSGIKGLTSIPEKNKNIVRPLLKFCKEEIIAYVTKNNIPYRNDSSNFLNDYLRNKIRNKVLPHFYESDERARLNLKHTIEHVNNDYNLLQNIIAAHSGNFTTKEKDKTIIFLDKLKGLEPESLLLYYLLNFIHISMASQIWEAFKNGNTGAIFYSMDYTLEISRNKLLVYKTLGNDRKEYQLPFTNTTHPSSITFPIPLNHSVIEMENAFNLNTERSVAFLNCSKVKYPLHLRKWRNGDTFTPFGMKGRKKLSDFFTDLKLSKIEKEKIWLLCDASDKIIWIIGYRIDNYYSVSDNTAQIVRLVWSLNPETD